MAGCRGRTVSTCADGVSCMGASGPDPMPQYCTARDDSQGSAICRGECRRGYRAAVTIDEHGASGDSRPQPRALIVTLYGLYARDRSAAGSAWLDADPAARRARGRRARGPLVDLAAQASRPARVADRWTAPQATRCPTSRASDPRRGRPTDLRASAGRPSVTAGCSRSSACPSPSVTGGTRLRSRLSWLGFGTVSAGVWIAPAHLRGRDTGRARAVRAGRLRRPVPGGLPRVRRPGRAGRRARGTSTVSARCTTTSSRRTARC